MKRASFVIAILALVVSSCGLKVPVTIVAGERIEDGFVDDAGPTDGVGVDDGLGGVEEGPDAGLPTIDPTATGGPIDGGGGLFENETEGVTNQQITICGHVPITGAAPIPHDEDRFGQFYFNYVNAELGGIYGRKVRFLAYNDEYNPAGARRAVEKCKRAGAFFYVGAAGTDQIVSVAKWAERNRLPYFHGPTSDKDLGNTVYDVHVGPTYEYQHELLAQYLIGRFGKDVKYGVVKVNSPYFDAGADSFVKEITKLGGEVVVNTAVQKDESNFQSVFFELQDKNVRVINNFTTPTIWTKMLTQKPAGYSPTWTAVSPVAGFNIVAAALKNSKAIVFHHFNPACECTTYKDEEISQHKNLPWYSDIQEFLRIFKKYSPEQDPPADDFDYASYLGAKALHRILLTAGEKPTRTKLWTLLKTYKEDAKVVSPGCAGDFTRTEARKGAWRVNIFELVSSRGVWKQIGTCVDKV